MATYPPVGDLERDDALARIRRRHERTDDSRWSEACVDSDDAARAVLDYLRRYRGRFPRQVVQDDVWDELVLAAWVYWDERRREHELLTHALARGLSLREVGAFVGVHSAQGLRDHLDSVEARLIEHRQLTRQLAGHPISPSTADDATYGRSPEPRDGVARPWGAAAAGPRDEPVARRSRNPYLRFQGRSRASRGADGKFVRAQRAAARARPARERWFDDHQPRIVSVLSELVRQTDRVLPSPGARDTESDPAADLTAVDVRDGVAGPAEYLDWVREDLQDGDVTQATIISAGLALNAVRLVPVVFALPRNHALHRALREVDRLRSDFAALPPADPSAGGVTGPSLG